MQSAGVADCPDAEFEITRGNPVIAVFVRNPLGVRDLLWRRHTGSENRRHPGLVLLLTGRTRGSE